MKNTFLKLIYCTLFLVVFPPTLGQLLPIEFASGSSEQTYYLATVTLLAILSLCFFRYKMKTEKGTGLTIFGLAGIAISIAYLGPIFFILVVVDFGKWSNEHILYVNKQNKSITINEQVYDVGTFGYGRRRTVKIIPLFSVFQIALEIDISEIENENWILVDQKGNLNRG